MMVCEATDYVVLKRLPTKYNYIARDLDGELCVFAHKPSRSTDFWTPQSYVWESLNKGEFHNIRWDRGVYDIKELLAEYEQQFDMVHLRPIQPELSYMYLVKNTDIGLYELIDLKYFSLIGNYRSIHSRDDLALDNVSLDYYLVEEVDPEVLGNWYKRLHGL